MLTKTEEIKMKAINRSSTLRRALVVNIRQQQLFTQHTTTVSSFHTRRSLFENHKLNEERDSNGRRLPIPIYTTKVGPILQQLNRFYIKHRTIMWLGMINIPLIYIPVVPSMIKIISCLSSIWLGYSSIQTHKNYRPVLVKSINFDIDDRAKFVIDRVDGKRDTVSIRDIVLDHEALYKVYVPFSTFFWRSFLLNKDDMSTRNELKFMIISVVDGRENRAGVEHDDIGNAIRTVYTVRETDDDDIETLRSSIEKIRELHTPNTDQ